VTTVAGTRVTMLCKTVTHYRVPFLDLLRKRLDGEGVDLQVVAGTPTGPEVAKRDTADLVWAVPGRCRALSVAGREVIWQPGVLDGIRSSLVIVEQASRLAVNYPLLAAHLAGRGAPVAMWGHGANLRQHKVSPLGESAKRALSRRVHWWFAYTGAAGQRVEALGYPSERITVFRNATDTRALRAWIDRVGEDDRRRVRARLGLPDDALVGLSVGSLYDDKRLPFLAEVARAVRRRCGSFHLVVIGDGPDRAVIEQAAARHAFIHVLPAAHGADLADLASVADVSIFAGLAGLGVLDSFALGLPVAATAYPYHSPEIDYVEPGFNGTVTRDWRDVEAFAADLADLLRDGPRRERLAAGARRTAAGLTVEHMAERVAEGVLQALSGPRYRGGG
jgi:glycosyltransferase involved in cell wall biosynthesis